MYSTFNRICGRGIFGPGLFPTVGFRSDCICRVGSGICFGLLLLGLLGRNLCLYVALGLLCFQQNLLLLGRTTIVAIVASPCLVLFLS